jgi:S1-C subfamily serine protease
LNVVDVIIILFFVTALVRGIELGVVRQLCSTTGLIVGLFVGAFIQGKLIGLVHSPASKAMLALVIILAAIGLFSTLGEYVGVQLRSRIERARRLKALDAADKAVGSVVAGATILLVVWLTASIFTNLPLQAIQRQVSNSFIIAQLNKSLPPAPDVVAKLGHLIDPNGFPDVFTGLEPSIDTDAPLPSIGELDAAVTQTRASVVRIEGRGCGGISQGSGFVADTNLVITNAHVIAGVDEPSVVDGKGRHQARVIWFDPELDMAVLETNNLAGEPLALSATVAAKGAAAAVLGYPGGGDFTADPATILDSFKAEGRNIYNQGKTVREVYSVKSDIRPGNSGGPLIDENGTVIGLIFAESTSYHDVGYALSLDKVIEGLAAARDQSRTVDTGNCTQ